MVQRINYPRKLNITGSNLTGSDAEQNRTYTLPQTNASNEGVVIYIQGTHLHEGSGLDYTVSGRTITFLNIVWDDQLIEINYFITPSYNYTTVLELAEVIGIKGEVPSWDIGSSAVKETVGTGNGSTTLFYLDQKNILDDSYTIYYGSSESTSVPLTEGNDFTINLDKGTITLTSSGVTKVDTNTIYAEYCYITNGMTNSYLAQVISRAEQEVNSMINSKFTDGSVTNPSYPLETEIQASEGIFQDRFFVKKKPLIDVVASLDGDHTSSITTISLVDASGLPSSGYIAIDSEVIQYTGVSTNDLTGCTRGALGTTAATHDDATIIHTTLFFRSDTSEGSQESFTYQPWRTSMYADEYGLIYKFDEASPDSINRRNVANRIKIIYYYGYNTIPSDITRLSLLLAKRMLVQDNLSKALIAGRDEFNPEMFNADKDEIMRIESAYRINPMGNT